MTGVMQQQQLHCTPRRGKGPTEASVEQQNANVAAGFAWDSVCGCRDGNKQTGSEQSPPQFQTGFLTVHSFIKLFQQHHPSKDCLGAKPGCFCLSLFLFFPSLLLKSTASMWTARSHHGLLTLSSPAELSTEPMRPERPPLKWSYLRQPSSPTSPCRTSPYLQCEGGISEGVHLSAQELLGKSTKRVLCKNALWG